MGRGRRRVDEKRERERGMRRGMGRGRGNEKGEGDREMRRSGGGRRGAWGGEGQEEGQPLVVVFRVIMDVEH